MKLRVTKITTFNVVGFTYNHNNKKVKGYVNIGCYRNYNTVFLSKIQYIQKGN